jgi:hypothetical protein
MPKKRGKEKPFGYTYSARYASFEEFRQADPWKAEQQIEGMRQLARMVIEFSMLKKEVTPCH